MKTPPKFELRALSPIAWVMRERELQTRKWGIEGHGAGKWRCILGEEVGEVDRALEERSYGKPGGVDWETQLEYELIQVAAVAVAWIESIRRGDKDAGRISCSCDKCDGGGPEVRPGPTQMGPASI